MWTWTSPYTRTSTHTNTQAHVCASTHTWMLMYARAHIQISIYTHEHVYKPYTHIQKNNKMTFLTLLCNSQKIIWSQFFSWKPTQFHFDQKSLTTRIIRASRHFLAKDIDLFLPLAMMSPIYTHQPPERSHGLDSLGPWRTWVGTRTPTGLVDHPAWANTAHRRFWATITQETLAKSELGFTPVT